MKQLFLFSACILFVFSSCKKDSNKSTNTTTPTNTITATINGVSQTFATSVTAQLVNNDPIYTLGITGFKASGTNPVGLQLAVNSDKVITKGTYTISSQPGSDPSVYPIIIYYASTGTFANDESSTDVTTITITSISGTNVQGTFSGVLVPQLGDGAKQTVTDGKFNVNITQ